MSTKRDDCRWWTLCILFRNTPRKVREKLSRPATSTRERIARLDPAIGGHLDGLDFPAPLRVYRFVAWANGACDQDRRLAIVLALRAKIGRWPTDGRLYAELRASDRPPSSRPTVICTNTKRATGAVMSAGGASCAPAAAAAATPPPMSVGGVSCALAAATTPSP